MQPQPGEMPDARALLTCIVPEMRPGEMIEGRYLLSGKPAERRFYGSRRLLLGDVAHAWRNRRHCYAGVALRLGARGDAASVSRAFTCWADVDYKLWRDMPDPAAAALEAVTDFPLRPSALVCSGGGLQPYWGLLEPYDVQEHGKERLETINAALARAVCGQSRTPDHVQDVARILRLPDTFNLKYDPPAPVRLVWCEPGQRYDLDEIERWLGMQYPWAMRPATAQNHESATAWQAGSFDGDLRARAARGRIRRATLDLLDLPGSAGYQSSSEADAAVSAGLITAGLTAVEAFVLLRESPRGQDALVRKGERHGEYYLRRTVARASEFAGPSVRALRFLRGA